MTTYRTGNPIGSKDPRDLYDNAENLDEAVNTRTAESWNDRFGVARKSWWGMEQDFQQFLINSGYQNIGDYGPGLEITARNQIFWRAGELYRAGAVLELPYTTTGDWGAEEALFVAVGDQALRQELADSNDPDNGAAMVALPGGGLVSDLVSADESRGPALIPYKGRTQYERNQDRIHIFDFIPREEHAAIIDGVSTYDATDDFHAAIAYAGQGSTIYLPHRGVINATSINVDKFNIKFKGDNLGSGYYSSVIKGTLDGVPLFNVSEPQFMLDSVVLWGLGDSIERGENITQDAILLADPNQNNNLDAIFVNCGFAFFRDAIDMRGRNIKVVNTLFSGCRRGVSIENHGFPDMRGLELYNPRFHSLGKLNSVNTACVWIDPLAGFNEAMILGGDADDCFTLYKGFSGNTKITTPMYKARGMGIVLDATSATASLQRRSVNIDYVYQGEGGIVGAAGALIASGPMQLDANLTVMGCTGTAVAISTSYAKLSGFISDAGQFANNTYDAVQIVDGTLGVYLDNLKVSQDQFGVKTNKARYGINDRGSDTMYGEVNVSASFASESFTKLSTAYSWGKLPGVVARVTESWGTAAPTTGTWGRGSKVWNYGVASTGTVYWVCTDQGSPGTWRAVAG